MECNGCNENLDIMYNECHFLYFEACKKAKTTHKNGCEESEEKHDEIL